VGGRLNRGGHCFANAIGHIPIVPDGLPCTCGLAGCLECYANAAALVRYAEEGKFSTSEQVITAANGGDSIARHAIDTLAQYLAMGCAALVHLLDPDLIVLAGGLAQNNPLLLSALADHLGPRVTAWRQRDLRIVASPLGYSAGVVGAAALAAASLAGTDSVRA
jgi:glucokinase